MPGNALFRGDERISPFSGDVVLHGEPDAVIRSRDGQETSEVLAYCHAHCIPVTFSGGRSGLTGAAATGEGVLIATEQRAKILDIGRLPSGQGYAVTEPGIRLGELKEAALREGYFYPPDPTSYQEACLGGSVATNATGEDTLLYGPTRKYIRGIKVIKADGMPLELIRPEDDRPPESKGTAGYIRYDPAIDLLIGSEGTLGYFSEITVDLLPNPADWWSAIAFFPDLHAALEFVQGAVHSDRVTPRALEFMDKGSLSILKTVSEIPEIPHKAQTAIYWKQEFQSENQREQGIQDWLGLLNDVLSKTKAPQLSEVVWVAQTPAERQRFRAWRHHIPSKINEQVSTYHAAGGGKVASDWWVPLKKIQKALPEALRESEEAGIEAIAFGHIGNGHPHINYMVKNSEDFKMAKELIRRQCRRAVKWGGGVAGEHGLGKVYRDLLCIQHPPSVIEKMIQTKREWDPHWILGRETLFQVPQS